MTPMTGWSRRPFSAGIWRRNDLQKKAIRLARHSEIPAGPLPEASSLRRTALAVERMDLLAQVAAGFFPAYDDALEQFRDRCQHLNIWQTPPSPILQGRHLIACGIRPGKNMGAILEKCFDAQLDGAFADEDGALAFLKNMNPLPED